jgi:hypothetical protein
MTTLHILPLQLELHPNLRLDIVCDDPFATVDAQTGILTIDLPRSPRGRQSVRFVVHDPSVHDGTHFHVTLQSAPPLAPLTQWHKTGTVSRSPYIPADTTIEVWATVLAIPDGDPAAAKVYHGKRNVKIATQGGGDLGILGS